ncbi:MAG: hypothetical protein WBA77_16135, partial [Microcoleaceae cyanobacterium]
VITPPQNTSQQPSEINDNQAIYSVTPSDLSRAVSREVEGLDIIPARGWIRDENGDVILVSYDEVTAAQARLHPGEL